MPLDLRETTGKGGSFIGKLLNETQEMPWLARWNLHGCCYHHIDLNCEDASYFLPGIMENFANALPENWISPDVIVITRFMCIRFRSSTKRLIKYGT